MFPHLPAFVIFHSPLILRALSKCTQIILVQHSQGTYSTEQLKMLFSLLGIGNALWFCQNFYFYFFPPSRFPDDNFWTPRRIVPKCSPVMVKRRSVSLSDPAWPQGGPGGLPIPQKPHSSTRQYQSWKSILLLKHFMAWFCPLHKNYIISQFLVQIPIFYYWYIVWIACPTYPHIPHKQYTSPINDTHPP